METRMPETKMAQNTNDSNVRDPGWPTFDHAFDRLTFASFNNLEQQDRVDRTSPRRSTLTGTAAKSRGSRAMRSVRSPRTWAQAELDRAAGGGAARVARQSDAGSGAGKPRRSSRAKK